MKINILLDFHGKYSKKNFFVKLIYLISRVFWSGFFLIFWPTYRETSDAKVCSDAFLTPELEWCKNGYNLGISSCNAICELHWSSILLIFKISDNNFSVDCVDPVRSSKSVKQFHKSSLNGTYIF